jgi:DNA-directed RNA polymerase subunit RPC12/RpoP
MDFSKNQNSPTPIMCLECLKESGYFLEDFINEKVDSPKSCKNCNKKILDKPNFEEPLLN